MAAIVTNALTKCYGDVAGIVDLDLEVRVGEVFGLLGPNGAGKTTTIRTLLDLLHPTSGSARVFGLDSRRDSVRIRRRVGYLPGELAMYDEMTGRELLRYFGALRRVECGERAGQLADRFDLDLDRRISAYSSGNWQKLAIVQAFMHDPELLILDEPTSSLDPLVQQEFYRLVREVCAGGRTVLLSSHVLPEVERIADRVGIVRASRLVTVETVDDLRRKARRRIELVFGAPVDPARFLGLAGVLQVEPVHDGTILQLQVEGALEAVMRVTADLGVANVISHEGDLEAAFLAFYEDGDAG